MDAKSLVYICPVCRKVAICGLWQEINDTIARILFVNEHKIQYEWKLCDECAATRPSPR